MHSSKIESFDPHSFLGSGQDVRFCNSRPARPYFVRATRLVLCFTCSRGRVQVGLISDQGKEGVTALHGAGEFFGQESLIRGRAHRTNAVATGPSTIAKIDSAAMTRVMEAQPTLASMFLSFVLSRNVQIEDDLVDHLFNSSEKRLARLLLNLAGVTEDGDGGGDGKSEGVIPKISQEALASRVGTTRGRINYFMNKFRKLGYVDYRGEITVRSTLVAIISEDGAASPLSFIDNRRTA